MEPMEPVYGAGTLLAIAASAVAVLLFLIMYLRMHAFVALILISFLTGPDAGYITAATYDINGGLQVS